MRIFSTIGAKIELRPWPLSRTRGFRIERKALCQARMVWRDRDAAGLVFANGREAGDVIPLAWAQKLRETTGQPETPVAPRSASVRALRSYEHG